MKYFFILIILYSPHHKANAQDLQLLNEVVYEQSKPIAAFSKKLYNADGVAGLTVSNSHKVLFTVIPKKMKAPVRELRSFYYHEFIFNDGRDSFPIYSTEALSLHVFNLIKKYKLIPGGKPDAAAFATLKQSYDQKPLDNKIESMIKFLNDTRNFQYQTERDRTKPVYLVNERVIMQDSMLIGYFIITENYQSSSNAITATNRIINPIQTFEVQMKSNVLISPELFRDCMPEDIAQRDKLLGNALYKISKPVKMSDANIYAKRLALACCLIENYAL